MFIGNKYTRWYYRIVESAKERQNYDGYCEKHHIIPKSLGGSNASNNLVRLTPREHFVCHRLLVKMTEGKNKRKMCWALHQITHQTNKYQTRYVPNSRTFQYLREELYTKLRGPRKISETHRANIIASNKRNKTGKNASAETRRKMSLAKAGKTLSQHHKNSISKGLKGKTKTEEHRKKLSESLKRFNLQLSQV